MLNRSSEQPRALPRIGARTAHAFFANSASNVTDDDVSGVDR
jgi:hypothetical protein